MRLAKESRDFHCPDCGSSQNVAHIENRDSISCETCHGTFFSFAFVSNLAPKGFLDAFVKGMKKAGTKQCPRCNEKMSVGFVEAVELDACEKCRWLWFDNGEMTKAIRRNKARIAKPSSASNEGLRNENPLVDLKVSINEPAEVFSSLVGGFGVENVYHLKRTPIVTYSLIGLCFMIGFYIRNSEAALLSVAFLPQDAFRRFGTTWVTSVFSHADFFHLLGNAVMLFLLGGDLEDKIGRKRYLEAFLISGVSGNILNYFLSPPHIHHVGASGAIFGIFAVYCLEYPRAKFSMTNLMFGSRIHLDLSLYTGRWIFAARLFLLSYFLINVAGAILQSVGLDQVVSWILPPNAHLQPGAEIVIPAILKLDELNGVVKGLLMLFQWLGQTSFLSHIGGAAAGILFWLTFPTAKNLDSRRKLD